MSDCIDDRIEGNFVFLAVRATDGSGRRAGVDLPMDPDELARFEGEQGLDHEQAEHMRLIRHAGQQHARPTAGRQGGDGLAEQALGQLGEQVFLEHFDAAVLPGFADLPGERRHGVLDKTLQALAGGAQSVLSIDSSGPALAQARANLALNPQLPAERAEWLEADVFQALRDFRKAGRSFDLIVLDPPKFAPSAAHADRAARAYKDINLLGFRLLKPGGLLMTYSCSGGIGLELFQKIVAGAALDAGREARIVRRLSGTADHPVALNFPEGEYLKGLLVQVD